MKVFRVVNVIVCADNFPFSCMILLMAPSPLPPILSLLKQTHMTQDPPLSGSVFQMFLEWPSDYWGETSQTWRNLDEIWTRHSQAYAVELRKEIERTALWHLSLCSLQKSWLVAGVVILVFPRVQYGKGMLMVKSAPHFIENGTNKGAVFSIKPWMPLNLQRFPAWDNIFWVD